MLPLLRDLFAKFTIPALHSNCTTTVGGQAVFVFSSNFSLSQPSENNRCNDQYVQQRTDHAAEDRGGERPA